LHTDLAFELSQLLADARLAGEQTFCGGGDVQPVVHYAEQVFELLEGHRPVPLFITDKKAAQNTSGRLLKRQVRLKSGQTRAAVPPFDR
jgi:hypothetical protein